MKLASSPSPSSSTVPLFEFHVAGCPRCFPLLLRSSDASLSLARSSRSAAFTRITHAIYTRVPPTPRRAAPRRQCVVYTYIRTRRMYSCRRLSNAPCFDAIVDHHAKRISRCPKLDYFEPPSASDRIILLTVSRFT